MNILPDYDTAKTSIVPAVEPVVRSLTLRFAEPLSAVELPAFRGAIAAAVGADAILFHQHETDGQLRYRYPLIQYRIWGGCPALFCLHNGVEAAQVFLQQPEWNLLLGGQPVRLTLADVRVRQHYLHILPESELSLSYRLRQWLPFNQANYAAWQQERSLAVRYALLEKLLVGHILAFASGVDWHVPTPIRVALTQAREIRGGRVKGQTRVAFDVEFHTNVVLPDAIGLGRHVSLGFGILEKAGQRPPVGSADGRARTPRPSSSPTAFDPTAE